MVMPMSTVGRTRKLIALTRRAAATPRRSRTVSHCSTALAYGAGWLADLVGVSTCADEPAERLVGVERLLDGAVLGVVADVADQFDGQLELVAVDGVGAVGDVVGESAQHVDVVVGDLDLQRAVGGRGLDVVVGARSDRSLSCSSAR